MHSSFGIVRKCPFGACTQASTNEATEATEEKKYIGTNPNADYTGDEIQANERELDEKKNLFSTMKEFNHLHFL